MNGRGDAQIVERGFQRYEGRRSGVAGAIRSVSWESIRSTLGLGRPARTKIFPVIAVVIAYLPAVVFVGIAVLITANVGENFQLRSPSSRRVAVGATNPGPIPHEPQWVG